MPYTFKVCLSAVFLFLCLIHGRVLAQQSHFLDFTRILNLQGVVSNGLFTDPAPSIEQIKQNLKNLKSPENLLQYLITSKPSLKSDFIILHHSQSLQSASPEFPRIILFGGGAAYAFSEYPNQNSYKVEMLYADSKTYEISLAEVEFKDGKATLQENPQACQSCHGMPAKPLWNPYDFWPNTIGSTIGRLSSDQEKEIYNRLYERKNSSPILSRLALPNKIDFETEDVTAFTEYISVINMGRWITQNIKRNDDQFKKYFYLLGQILSSCNMDTNQNNLKISNLDYLNKYFDLDALNNEKNLFRKIENDVIQSREFFKKSLDSYFNEYFPTAQISVKIDHSRLQSEVNILAQIQWVLALANIDASNLTPSLFYNNYLISTPSFFPIDFLTTFYELRPELFSGQQIELMDLGTQQKRWIRFKCNQDSEKIKIPAPQKRADLYWTSYLDYNKNQPVVSRCARCHSAPDRDIETVPYIPFDKSMQMAELLKSTQGLYLQKIMTRITSPHDSDQLMPPQKPLTESEISAFKNYLMLLSN